MADISGSYLSNQSYNPKFTYSISYSETGRSGSAVTYRFNVSFTKQNGWYGYDININWNIGGATGSKQIKSTSDVSSGSTSFDVTCSTNAAGGTLSARIYTSSSTDGTHWQNAMDTGTRTVNKSTFNTPPSLSGTVTTSPSGTIPENTAVITLTSPVATDANNNLSGYRFRVSVNDGGYTEIGRSASRTMKFNCANYGEGTKFLFIADAYDSYGEWSPNVYSATVIKNKFTHSTISSSSSIKYSDVNQIITFSVGASSNTDGSKTLSRALSCGDIPVYNNEISTGTVSVTVYRTGTLPTGPYIKFDDVKNRLKGSNYNGTITFTLTTTNIYSNSKTSQTSINVDLRTNPNPVSSCNIVEGTGSTAYKKVASTGTYYFIPDGSNVIQVSWAGGSGKLGESITYSLYVAYGSGGWQLVADKLTSTSYNHTVAKQTTSQLIKYMVRVVNSYGYTADAQTPAKTLHYYNSPGLTPGTLTRGATTCDVIITVKSNSSITNINTTGTWICYNKGTTTVVTQGSLGVAQTAQTLKLTGLTDAGQYDLKITYNDNTGFSSNQTYTISVGANSPIFFVNKYGVGIGGVKATPDYALNIRGDVYLDGRLQKEGTRQTWVSAAQGVGCLINMVSQSSYTPLIRQKTSNGAWVQAVYNGNNMYFTYVSDATIASGQNTYDGQIIFPSDVKGTIYTTGNKPTPADIGAAPSSHTHAYLPLSGGTVSGNLYLSGGNQVDASAFNLNGYKNWDTGNFNATGGQASIVNDNGSYKALMILGNSSGGAGRIVKVWDTLDVQGNLKVSGTHVVERGTNSDGSAYYLRFYDGTQICWGRKWYGTVNQQNNMATAVYGGNSVAMTFPAAFSNSPVVTANCSSTGYANAHAANSTSTVTVLRFWSNYATTADGIEISYTAVGRWK